MKELGCRYRLTVKGLQGSWVGISLKPEFFYSSDDLSCSKRIIFKLIKKYIAIYIYGLSTTLKDGMECITFMQECYPDCLQESFRLQKGLHYVPYELQCIAVYRWVGGLVELGRSHAHHR